MKIAQLFGKGKTVFSCEVFPPKKTSPVDSIYKTLDGLKDIHPDFISVTFGAGGSSNVNQSTAEIASIIQNQYHITAMAHLTCVGCTKGEATEVLAELKEIAGRGGIGCGCGSTDYGIKVGYSAVDLVCARCGAALRLPAATPDDLDRLCAQYTLTIPGKKEP